MSPKGQVPSDWEVAGSREEVGVVNSQAISAGKAAEPITEKPKWERNREGMDAFPLELQERRIQHGSVRNGEETRWKHAC